MLILQSERLRALTKRGVVAFTVAENLEGLQNEAIELADALAKLRDATRLGDPKALKLACEATALEAADCTNMLDRLRAVLCVLLGDVAGTQLWDQAQDIKLAKAERKVAEQEQRVKSAGGTGT